MSREKELLKNTFILGIGYAVPAFVSFLVLPLYTAFLTKAEYGTYDLITILLSLMMPTITLQIKSSVFRFLIESRDNEEERKYHISTAYLFTTILSILSLILLLIILPGTPIFTKLLICIYIFQEVIIDLSKQTARGLGSLNKYIVSITINSLLLLIFSYILLSNMKKGLNGVLIALNCALIVSNIYIFITLDLKKYISYQYFSKSYLKKMLSFSAPMVPNSISLWVVRLSDRLVVTIFMGLEADAVYAIANRIPGLLSQVMTVFNLSWQESASLAVNDNDATEYYSEITQQTIDFLIGSAALLIALIPFFFKILIKGSYDEAYSQIPILICGVFFSCLSSCYGSIYIALKETKYIGITSVIGAVLNLTINMMFINKLGLFAASLSTLISYCVIFFARVIQLKKYILICLNWRKNFISFGILLFICVIYYFRSSYGNIFILALACGLFLILNKEICKKFILKCLNR